MRPNCCEKFKRFKKKKNLKIPKKNPKTSRRMSLKKKRKILSSKETFQKKKKSSERLTLKKKIKNFKGLKRISKEIFQISKIQVGFQKWKKVFKGG